MKKAQSRGGSFWHRRASEVIVRVITDAKGRGLSVEETKKLVDAAYPFGPRQHAPYKAWLEERKHAFLFLDGRPSMQIPAPKTVAEQQAVEKKAGQTSWLEE